MGVTFDQVRFKQAHSNKKSNMKMLKYILPLMLLAVTTTSAFSLGSLFHSEDNAEDIEALDEAEDFVDEEDQEEEFDEEEDEDEENEEEEEDEEDYEEDEEEEDYEEDEEEEDFEEDVEIYPSTHA